MKTPRFIYPPFTSALEELLTEPRGRFTGQTKALVMPESSHEIETIVKWCNHNRTTLTIQGGNTGLVGAQIPQDPNGILLSLNKLNAIHEVSLKDFTVKAQSGVTLLQLQNYLKPYGLTFPIQYASQHKATLGGAFNHNSGGVKVTKYGTMRNQVIGCEMILGSGQLLNINNVCRKNSLLNPLIHSFIGSEGNFGIVTELTLNVVPLEKNPYAILLAADKLESIIDDFSLLKQRYYEDLSVFEYMNQTAFELGFNEQLPYPHYALIILDNPINTLPALNSKIIGTQFNDEWLQLRMNLSDAQKKIAPSYKFDLAFSLEKLSLALTELNKHFYNHQFTPSDLVIFGHLGDNNLHYDVFAKQFQHFTDPRFIQQWQQHDSAVSAICFNHQGSFCAEHGIGYTKKHILQEQYPALFLLKQQLKRIYDPNGILNPHNQ